MVEVQHIFLPGLQSLRAQEVAQAEAEEREDLEIAAEAAGNELSSDGLPARAAKGSCFDLFIGF